MKYEIKVISSVEYQLEELKLGSRIMYSEVEVGTQKFMGIVSPNRVDKLLIPDYIAAKVLTAQINAN